MNVEDQDLEHGDQAVPGDTDEGEATAVEPEPDEASEDDPTIDHEPTEE